MTAVLAVALIFTGVDGSPWEASAVNQAVPVVAPARAVRTYTACTTDILCTETPITLPDPPSWAACPQWWYTALAAGFSSDQMPTVMRVMKCESQCDPRAYNPSGASGLMQVLQRYFTGGEDPFDPQTNLNKAFAVWKAQGWRAWSCF